MQAAALAVAKAGGSEYDARVRPLGNRPGSLAFQPLAPAAAAVRARRWTLSAIALIVAAGVSAYSNSFEGEFVFDDLPAIRDNPDVRHAWPPWRVVFSETLASRPVLGLTLAANYALGGLDVRGYHAVNLAIHVLAAGVLFGLVRRTLRLSALRERFGRAADPLALAAALVWMVHPLQTASVTYIIQRGESLMGLFYLLTFYAVLRAAESSRPKGWYAAAAVACALGMGTKQVMLTAPVAVLLYDRTFLAGTFREALRRRWGLYAAMAASWLVLVPHLAAVGSWFVMGLMSSARQGVDYRPLPTSWEYARSQVGVLVQYLRLAAWPSPLCVDYGWPVADTMGGILPPAVVVGVLAAAAAWGLARRWAAGFLGAAFFLVLAPTSSIVSTEDPAFEHRMYLPLACVVVLAVCGAYAAGLWVLGRFVAADRPRRLLGWVLSAAAVLAAVAALGCATVLRNGDYRTALGLWEDTVRKRPENPRAHCNLGSYLRDAGNLSAALVELNRALALRPHYPAAFNDRGKTYLALARPREAIEDFTRVLEAIPKFSEALYGRGTAYRMSSMFDEAIADYSRLIELTNGAAVACNARGIAWQAKGRLDQALRDYDRAIETAPDYAPAYNNRAFCHFQMKAYGLAWKDLRQSERLGYPVLESFKKALSDALGQAP